MPELCEVVSDTKALMSSAALELEFVADQLRDVGIAPKQATMLVDIAADLRAQQKLLGESHIDDLDGQIQKGRETTGLILKGLLTGAIGRSPRA